MSFTQPWFEVDFGKNKGGIATVGYRLYKSDGTDSVARTTVGVQDISGNGAYGVANVVVPDDAVGIEWDTGGGGAVYAVEDLEPYRNRYDGYQWLITYVDDAVSSRAAPGDAMDLITDAVDADALADSALFELDGYLSTEHGGGSWEGSTAAAVADAVWDEQLSGHQNAGSAGEALNDGYQIILTNLDTTVSSRAAPGDAMDLITDAVDANALADSALFELDGYLSTEHGGGSWEGSTAAAVADAVWDELLSGHTIAGSAGEALGDGYQIILTNLDTTVSSRAAPGDAMDLIADAVDANALADSALFELDGYLVTEHGDGSWQSASVVPGAIADAVWDELLDGHQNARPRWYRRRQDTHRGAGGTSAAIDGF